MLFTLRIFRQLILPRKLEPRLVASESIQDSTDTKSDTKLGIEHLKIASLPVIMLSGDILISYLWFVTERRNKIKSCGHATSDGRWEGSSLPDIALVNRFPSESTQESTLTKSATKLGTEQEKIASLPTMTLSRNMSTSKCWFVTERFKQIKIHNQRDRLESYEVSNLDKI